MLGCSREREKRRRDAAVSAAAIGGEFRFASFARFATALLELMRKERG